MLNVYLGQQCVKRCLSVLLHHAHVRKDTGLSLPHNFNVHVLLRERLGMRIYVHVLKCVNECANTPHSHIPRPHPSHVKWAWCSEWAFLSHTYMCMYILRFESTNQHTHTCSLKSCTCKWLYFEPNWKQRKLTAHFWLSQEIWAFENLCSSYVIIYTRPELEISILTTEVITVWCWRVLVPYACILVSNATFSYNETLSLSIS